MIIQKGIYIENRYEILEKIGSGGMSDVYKARCHKLNRFVAIKFLKPEYCEDKNFVKNFQIEAQSAAALLHPNVVSVYDVNQTDGIYYIVMEYVDGITLKKYTDRNGRLPIKEATSIAIQIAQGIDAAHNANIIHRDIKPQNVLISREGKIKVTDFGIARTTTANTISTDILGSVQYISPEQARGGQVDNRTDIYSFGIVFYEMITGKLPFDGDSTVSIALKHIQEDVPLAGDIVDGVPNSVSKIIEKCTQRKPDRRYQKTTSLLADLKTSLITPNEDFVVLEPEPSDSATIILSDEDAEIIRREAKKMPAKSSARYGNSRNSRSSSKGGRQYSQSSRARSYEHYDNYNNRYKPRNSGSNRRKPPYKKSKGDKILIICGIIAGFIIVAVLLFVILKTFNTSETPKQPLKIENESTQKVGVPVPYVVGMEVTKAQNELKNCGFIVRVKYAHSDSIARECVIEQSVKNGINLETGQEIVLTVSSGQDTKTLERYSGKDQETAASELKAAGFKVKVVEEFSDDVDEGIVIDTNPVYGSEVALDSVIELHVSKGPEIKTIVVPSVMGYTESGARDILTLNNLNVYAEYVDDWDFDGIVMYQYPVPGEEVEENSWISITVGVFPENNNDWDDDNDDPDYPDIEEPTSDDEEIETSSEEEETLVFEDIED